MITISEIQNLALEITSHCNIRCPQCSRTNWNGELASFVELKNWDVDKILPHLRLDLMTDLKLVSIEGDNGDAAMHPELQKIMDAVMAAPSRPWIFIVTNGSMRQPEWWGKLAEIYGSRLVIQFSIDGLRDTHELYRVGSAYDKVIKNARAFIQSGGVAFHRCLIFKHNQHQLQEISDRSRDIGFRRMIFRLGDEFRFQGQDEWPVYWKNKQTHIIKPVLTMTPDQYQKFEFDLFGSPIEIKTTSSLCPFTRKGQLHITYKGHVIPCCKYQADLYFDHPSNDLFRQFVGDINGIDINTRSLDAILSDPEFYMRKLESNLDSDSRLPRCQAECGSQIDAQLRRLRKI